jgi:hypothetical protein
MENESTFGGMYLKNNVPEKRKADNNMEDDMH